MTPMEISLLILLTVVTVLLLRERGKRSLETLKYAEMAIEADVRRIKAEKALNSLLRGLADRGIHIKSVTQTKVDDPGWTN